MGSSYNLVDEEWMPVVEKGGEHRNVGIAEALCRAHEIVELRDALEALDWERLEMLAHRLKGAGGSYGYPDLSGVAARMERDCKARRSDGLDDRMRVLEQLTAAAHAGLRAR